MAGKQLSQTDRCVVGEGGKNAVDNQTGEGTPKATWVFKTDNDGYISYSEDYKVSGSELYKINGIPVIPIGTIIIQETKAPEGYLLNSDKYVVHFTLQPDGTVRSDKGSWVTANKCENLDVCSEERTIRGGVEFKKADKDTNGNNHHRKRLYDDFLFA